MRQTRNLMGMHVTVEVRDGDEQQGCERVFEYFQYIDETFSTYKPNSAISQINRGELAESQYPPDIKKIFLLAEETRKATRGYFNIRRPEGFWDPSGIVKGWAIWQASLLLERAGHKYFFIDAGGDIQGQVADPGKQSWRVGIRNPFKHEEIVKVLRTTSQGVATSGTAERGQHIYNPFKPGQQLLEIVSLTIIGPNVYEADRFATAAFAMGRQGINFIESLEGLEGYMIDSRGMATKTSGFEQYVTH